MAWLRDSNGDEALVGHSFGRWLSEDDFVSTEVPDARSLGNVGFPRQWPHVQKSKPLLSLIGLKKGLCGTKKVGVVVAPTQLDKEAVKHLDFYPLQSFSNAERVEKAVGFRIVRGWAVFEHLDKDVSQAFVAERFWWNVNNYGVWVDFTPRPEEWKKLFLAESNTYMTKPQELLTPARKEFLQHLMMQRFQAVLAERISVVASTAEASSAASSAGGSVAREAEWQLEINRLRAELESSRQEMEEERLRREEAERTLAEEEERHTKEMQCLREEKLEAERREKDKQKDRDRWKSAAEMMKQALKRVEDDMEAERRRTSEARAEIDALLSEREKETERAREAFRHIKEMERLREELESISREWCPSFAMNYAPPTRGGSKHRRAPRHHNICGFHRSCRGW